MRDSNRTERPTIEFAIRSSSLGPLMVARKAGGGLAAVSFGTGPAAFRRELEARYPGARLIEADRRLRAIADRVAVMVEAPGRAGQMHDLPLQQDGTAFQRKVWRALREIPTGSTATYGEIARRIGHPRSVRAVARACANNPLAVIVPCHRVVRSDGALSGYRWGVARKRALLEREAGDQA